MSETTTEPQGDAPEKRTQTFGERAVGMSFNPSQDSRVDRVKASYAYVIDMLRDEYISKDRHELSKIVYETAVSQAITSQMSAVKLLTLNK